MAVKFRREGKVEIPDAFGWGNDLEGVPSAYEEIDKITTIKAQMILRDALGGYDYTRPSIWFPRVCEWTKDAKDYHFLEVEVELPFAGEDDDAYAFSFDLIDTITRNLDCVDDDTLRSQFIEELSAFVESLKQKYRS